jgi:hypothetical protein
LPDQSVGGSAFSAGRFSPRSPLGILDLPKQINYAALVFGDAIPEVLYLLLRNVFPSPIWPPLADTHQA